MTRINPQITKQLLGNFRIQGLIVAETNLHPRTIENWIKDNSHNLANPAVSAIIMRELNVQASDLFQPEPQTA